jgi:hypothetical protein
MQESEQRGVTKVPIFGDIPVLGWLFKFKSLSKTKTNLLVFLTPHIVKESSQLTDLTKRKQKTFAFREKNYIEGELMVRFHDDISKDKAEEIIFREKATVIKYIEGINVYHIKLRPAQDVEDAVKEFTAMPEVTYAEPNFIFSIPENPARQYNKNTINKRNAPLKTPDTSFNYNDTPLIFSSLMYSPRPDIIKNRR